MRVRSGDHSGVLQIGIGGLEKRLSSGNGREGEKLIRNLGIGGRVIRDLNVGVDHWEGWRRRIKRVFSWMTHRDGREKEWVRILRKGVKIERRNEGGSEKLLVFGLDGS
jgi:hypothetical protein